MKRVLILSGGTAAAWYLTRSAKQWFPESIEIIIGDIYPKELIPAASIADGFIQVPHINSIDYYEKMLLILRELKPDYIIPIIDDDLFWFYRDNLDLAELSIKTSAPSLRTVNTLSNKRNMTRALLDLNIRTPKIIEKYEDVNPETLYFAKPPKGHGSIGGKLCYGRDLSEDYDFSRKMVQVACNSQEPELTIDVFCKDNKIYTCARKRISVKAGVCVKMVLYDEPDLQHLESAIKTINQEYPLPLGSCVQFMKDCDGNWNLIDFNLRLGGGTALSDAAGFQIGRAMFASFLGEGIPDSFFDIDYRIKSVLRVYEEIAIK